MATCKLCNKRGLFLKLSSNGLCPPCHLQFGLDLENSSRIINDCINLVENSQSIETKLSRCDLFIRHANILARYENVGISTTEPQPTELIHQITEKRAEIVNEHNAKSAAKDRGKREGHTLVIRSESIPEDVDETQFALQQAYKSVMASIEVAEEVKKTMYSKFAAAFNSGGGSRYMDDVCVDFLFGSGWKWKEFDRWYEYFRVQNEWPYMWSECFPRLQKAEDIGRMPQDYNEALPEVYVKDLKGILRNHGVDPKPKPTTRIAVELLVRKHIPFEVFLPLAKNFIVASQQNRESWRERDKCRLLGHTIMITAGNLRFWYNLERNKPLLSRKYHIRACPCQCPVEGKFAAKFDAGEINTLPPWFPGDRTGLVVDFK